MSIIPIFENQQYNRPRSVLKCFKRVVEYYFSMNILKWIIYKTDRDQLELTILLSLSDSKKFVGIFKDHYAWGRIEKLVKLDSRPYIEGTLPRLVSLSFSFDALYFLNECLYDILR
eukprot:TRINITY_DN10042_c0_g1_i1.p1 TRINITY_DN10042_c0_g1~~TRINITY_DN10042_c0_g1_i1.p1  ORF type:complete len:116 (-),score=10.29 TRINITY_DN10042_c0_g1_i1:63-410(-)